MLVLSSFGQIRTVAEFRQKKINYYCESNYSKVVNSLDRELSLLESHKSEYSEELFLTLKNFLVVDKLYFSLENGKLPKSKKSYFKEIILTQEEACDDFMKGKSYRQLSGDFLYSLGDLKCQTPFVISVVTAVPRLTKAKDLYENAVINSPGLCAAYISKALWYDYAPGISGGSHKKAYEIILQAEKNARTNSDLFFTFLFKGQILNNLKRYDEAESSLNKAHNLFPNEKITNIIGSGIQFEED